MFKVNGSGITPYWTNYQGQHLDNPKFVIFLNTVTGEELLRPEFFKRFNGAVELQDGVEVPEEGNIRFTTGISLPPGVPLEDGGI